MNTESWLLLMIAAVITAGYGGYLLGRRNSEQRQEIERLEQELNAARERADQVKSGVNTHFERSAVIFSQLAKDYRQFLDHFQSSAKELGLSEGRAEELLDQVARPLLAHDQEPPAAAAMDAASAHAQPEAATADSPATSAAQATAAATAAKTDGAGETEAAAEQASADAHAGDGAAESGTRRDTRAP